MRPFTAGGHNLHDEAGRPHVNGAVMFWTEAVLSKVERLPRVRRALTHLLVKGDPSMVLGLSRLRFVVESVEFHRAHPGHPEITPMRGTLVARYRQRLGRRRFGSLLSHRINGSEEGHLPPPPYVPGEVEVRRELYRVHAAMDELLTETLLGEGRDVLNGGDYNRHGGRVFPEHLGLVERGENPDRVAASKGLRLGPIRWGRKAGSDHPSWTVRVTPGKARRVRADA